MATKGCNAVDKYGAVVHFISRSEAAKWLIFIEGLELQTNTVIRKINAAIRDEEEYCGYKWVADGEGVDYVRDEDEHTQLDDYKVEYRRKEKNKSHRNRRKNNDDDWFEGD